jgi:hypothetical protein
MKFLRGIFYFLLSGNLRVLLHWPFSLVVLFRGTLDVWRGKNRNFKIWFISRRKQRWIWESEGVGRKNTAPLPSSRHPLLQSLPCSLLVSILGVASSGLVYVGMALIAEALKIGSTKSKSLAVGIGSPALHWCYVVHTLRSHYISLTLALLA